MPTLSSIMMADDALVWSTDATVWVAGNSATDMALPLFTPTAPSWALLVSMTSGDAYGLLNAGRCVERTNRCEDFEKKTIKTQKITDCQAAASYTRSFVIAEYAE